MRDEEGHGHLAACDQRSARAWPTAPHARLFEVGTGVGVVFSPDLSVKGNCHFYAALGFACFDDSDWTRALDGVHEYNARFPARAIRTIVLETHGTNGQGVRYIILSACNSGRLLRLFPPRDVRDHRSEPAVERRACGVTIITQATTSPVRRPRMTRARRFSRRCCTI